ncbi:MAG: ACT domain-containing protein, partial [Christensenellales bacterium]
EGISRVSAEDIAVAKKLGYTIKLLAIGKKMDNHLEVRVHPTMLHDSHPLANVSGVFNGIFLTGDAVDDIMLYGRGAGKLPTASAIVSDVIYAAKASEHKYMTFVNEFDAPQWLVHQKDWLSGYFLRLTVADELGALSKIAGVLGDSGVSVHSVMQFNENPNHNTAELVFITDTARELSVQSALARLRSLPCVISVDSVMRVED